MAGLFKSIFGKASQVAPTAGPSKPVEDMSFEDVLGYCNTLGDNPPFRECAALLKRLYNIALYDHHVSASHREGALTLIASLRRDLEGTLADNPEGLVALQNANRFTEENAERHGIYSLAWKLEEYAVPNDQVVQYIMRPEHGHLLSNFLAVIDPDTVRNMKPLLVRYLIHSRPYSTCYNAVLCLHALAAHGDKAAVALFTEDEYRALLNVPEDYDAARGVLVGLGLLPSAAASTPIIPLGIDDQVVIFIARVLKQKNTADEHDQQLENLPEVYKSALLLGLVYLRFYLARHMLRQLCNDNVSSQVTAIIRDLDARNCFAFFEKKAEALAALEPGTPCDYVLMMEVLSIGGADPKTEKDFERDKAFLNFADARVNQERAEFLSYLRFLLRWLSASSEGDTKSSEDEEVLKSLYEMYLASGTKKETPERSVCFEDWIGEQA